jgi:hypothetical protein
MPKPTRITRIGTVIVPIADQDRALAFYVDTPFRDPDGNRLRMVQRD